MLKLLRKFIKNNEGATAIEFVVVAPVLFMLIFGVIEFGMVSATTNILNGATAYVARYTKAHAQTGSNGIGEAKIRQLVLSRTKGGINNGNFLKSNRLVIYSKQVGWNNNGMHTVPPGIEQVGWSNTGSKDNANGGGVDEVRQYTLIYKYKSSIPYISNLIGNDGYYILKSSIIVQNEPAK